MDERAEIVETGSPPPMRGKATRCEYRYASKGITPAYAGKSWGFRLKTHATKDHPRLCGEKLIPAAFAHRFQGSPPPMRGKAVTGVTAAVAGRITPAYAGKRLRAVPPDGFFWDHPRLCGEKRLFQSRQALYLGSPPPMRGKD